MSKYQPLIDYLQQSKTKEVPLGFDQIIRLLGEPLPDSAKQYPAWWANSSPGDSHTWAHAWQTAGWKVASLDLPGENVVFRRTRARSGAGQTNWERELTALKELGGSATLAEIHHKLVETHGSFDAENVRKDMVMLSVNDPKRFAYRAWKTRNGASITNLDRVFAGAGPGKDRRYDIYDPGIHGLWEVYQKLSGGPDLRPVSTSSGEAAVQAAARGAEFDPKDGTEGKAYAMRAIAVRRGGAKFRQALLTAFGGECCVTGCTLEAVLEAAHICAYDGKETNHPTNGLLLRADIHTLFDLGWIAIDPVSLSVNLHPQLRLQPAYRSLHNTKIKVGVVAPSKKSLAARWDAQMTW